MRNLKPLGDILPIRYGKAKSDRHGVLRQETPVYGSSGQIGIFDRALTTGSAVIVGRKGSAGAVYYSEGPCWPIDTAYFAEGSDQVHLPYFRYLLESLQLVRYDRSTAIPSLSRDDYSSILVDVPPLSDQRRIVAGIEEQLTRLEAGVTALKRAQVNLNRYRASVLSNACRVDQRVLLKGWTLSTVGELADVGTGATPSRTRNDYWLGGTIPWVTSTVVNDAMVSTPSAFVTALALKETNCRLYPPGTLLVAMYGEGKTRGMCSELGISAATNQALAAIQAPSSIRKYLKLVLQASYERTRQTASGGVQPNLNLSLVKAIPVPLPPEHERMNVIGALERRLSAVSRTESRLATMLARSSQIRQAILDRAFNLSARA